MKLKKMKKREKMRKKREEMKLKKMKKRENVQEKQEKRRGAEARVVGGARHTCIKRRSKPGYVCNQERVAATKKGRKACMAAVKKALDFFKKMLSQRLPDNHGDCVKEDECSKSEGDAPGTSAENDIQLAEKPERNIVCKHECMPSCKATNRMR